jgi:hypothetical protein
MAIAEQQRMDFEVVVEATRLEEDTHHLIEVMLKLA